MIDDKHVLELSSKKMRNILKLVDTRLVVEGYLPEDEKEIIEELIKDVS